MNQQREVVYKYRRQILAEEGLRGMVTGFIDDMAEEMGFTYVDEKTHPEEWDKKSIKDAVYKQFDMTVDDKQLETVETRDALIDFIADDAKKTYQEKIGSIGEESFGHLEKIVMLHTLDTLWKDHLLAMDHLKEGIGLRGYGQRNPLQEYKKEGFDLFTDMLFRFKQEVCERLFKVQIAREEEVASLEPVKRLQNFVLSRGAEGQRQGGIGKGQEEKPKPV